MEPRVGIATFVRAGTPRARGITSVYRLDPPLQGHEYVVVSAIDKSLQADDPLTMLFRLLDPFAEKMGIIPPVIDGGDPDQETFIFACDEYGNTENPYELEHLPGSVRGTMDHVRALQQAGYEIKYATIRDLAKEHGIQTDGEDIDTITGKRAQEE